MRQNPTQLLGLVALCAVSSVAWAQEAQIHPSKQVFADLPTWPVTSPGAIELPHFQPFRAVYERRYTQGSGPGKGEPRRDRVIVSAESVGWDGHEAVGIQVVDSAIAEHADTNARTLFMVVDARDLAVLFETGPIPGKAKDYYFARYEGGDALVSYVMTGTQELQPQKTPLQAAGFGPGSWVMAAMDLVPGAKIRLAPYYSPRANPISQSDHGYVLDKTTVQDGSGQSHSAWVVESLGWYGASSSKTLRLHLKDSPPYLVGVQIYDHDSGEAKPFVWLRDVQMMTP